MDDAGKKDYKVLPKNNCPHLIIEPGGPYTIRATIPSYTCIGQPFILKLSVLDSYNNKAICPFQEQLYLKSAQDIKNLPYVISPGNWKDCCLFIPGLECRSRGFFRIKLFGQSRKIVGKSNYLKCTESPARHQVYFGDIHVHTAVSDGLGSPNDTYDHARNVAHSDFAAISDHSTMECSKAYYLLTRKMPNSKWKELQTVARNANKAGEFVMFRGVEYTFIEKDAGHKNVYFLKDDEPLFDQESIEKLWDFLKERGDTYLLISHHTIRKKIKFEMV